MIKPISQDAAGTPVTRPIDPGVRIGHVHLKVADLDRALAFYCGVLGFELIQRYGTQAAFVSAGGYHHHIGLNTWESKGGSPPPPGTTGLYHVAILYPTRAALADALYRLAEADRRVRLTIFTGLTLTRPRFRSSLERRFAKPLLDRLLARCPEPLYAAALREDIAEFRRIKTMRRRAGWLG